MRLDCFRNAGEVSSHSSAHLKFESQKREFCVVNKTSRTIIEVIIFFCSLSVFSNRIQITNLLVPIDNCTGTVIGFCAHRFLKVRSEYYSMSSIPDFSRSMAPYMLGDSRPCQIRLLAPDFKGRSPSLQQKTPVNVGSPFEGEQGLYTDIYDQLPNTDGALRCVR